MQIKNIFIALAALSMATIGIASDFSKPSFPFIVEVGLTRYERCFNTAGANLFSAEGKVLYRDEKGDSYLCDGWGNYNPISEQDAKNCLPKRPQAAVSARQNCQNQARNEGSQTEPSQDLCSATPLTQASDQSSSSSSSTIQQTSGQFPRVNRNPGRKKPTQKSFDHSSSTNSASFLPPSGNQPNNQKNVYVARPIFYNPKITPVAVGVGLATAQLAKGFGTTEKKAFLWGLLPQLPLQWPATSS